jgi:hypothetical protein
MVEMSFRLEWIYAKRVIYGYASGELTFEDALEGSKTYLLMVEEGTPFIHSILDIRHVDKFPTLSRVRSSMTGKMSSKEGWMIIIGGNPALRFIASVVMQIFNYRFRMVETPEEAVALLKKYDDTLRDAVIELPEITIQPARQDS